MSSNLPPGCNIPDGISDPALETALEELCNDIRTPAEANALAGLLPQLRYAMAMAHSEGKLEGGMEALEQVQREMLKPARCSHDVFGTRCCLEPGHKGRHMYKCAGPSCPGFSWVPANTPHPAECNLPLRERA